MRASRRAAAAAGLLGLALTATACGGSHPSATATHPSAHTTTAKAVTTAAPLEAIKLAAANAKKASSAHVAGTISVTVPGQGSTPLTIHVVGDERWAPKLVARMTMSGMQMAGLNLGTIKMIMTDKAIYMNVPMLAQQLGKAWMVIRFADLTNMAGVDLSQLTSQAEQMDPSQYVEMLTASGDVKQVGTETVDGVATTHYAGTVDVKKALELVDPSAAAQARQLLDKSGISTEHVDVWLDGAHQVVRTKVSGKGSNTTFAVDLHMSHYGEKVDVTPPPANDTADLAKLMGQLGGATG